MTTIARLEERLAALEESISSAAAGDLEAAVPIGAEADALAAIELGFNMLLEEVSLLRREDRERQEELAASLAKVHEQARALEELTARQEALILELSTPIIDLWDRVLAVPLLGAIHEGRAAILMERVLQAVAAKSSAFLLIDVTGAREVDAITAQELVRLVRAVELLGTTCLISGVQPAVALALAASGIDLSSIRTYASMRTALDACFQELEGGGPQPAG